MKKQIGRRQKMTDKNSIKEPLNAFPPADGFTKIYNFRKVPMGKNTSLEIYRCASVSCATEQDCNMFIEKYKFVSIVDLRKLGDASIKAGKNRTLKYFPRVEESKDNGCRQTVNYNFFTKKTNKLLVNNNVYTWHGLKMISSALFTICVYVIMKIVLFPWPKYRKDWKNYFIATHLRWIIAPFCVKKYGGPMGMTYQCMLEGSKEVIFNILKTIAEPKNRPCVFHCASGKDRTGLVAMFLMASAGCTREDIIHEYNKSEDWGISHTHAELIGAGGDGPNKYVDLDTKKNLASPRWAMEATLDYLDKNYNGIEGYLDSIGFTKEWRAKLN